MTFLDRLGKAMQMDEISQEIGLDLQTESLLVRAEQLARLETDKLVDKVKGTIDITFFNAAVTLLTFIPLFCVSLSCKSCVLTARHSICTPATRPYRGFGASDRSTSFPVSKK